MTLRLIGMAKTNARILALATAASSLCSLVPATFGQDPIRVETNQVLVPVVVIKKEEYSRMLRDPRSINGAVLPGEVEAIASGLLVHDLTTADFQVLDDSKEQPIRTVTEEPSLYWNVRDNKGYHTEYIGPGGGKWSTAEWPPGLTGDIDPPQHYLIAYTVPDSPEGSCHQVKVKVDRQNVLVRARNEYCNTKHSAADPLSGTPLGAQLESHFNLPRETGVDILVLATTLYSANGAARVHIALDWPWKSLEHGFGSKTKSVLGMVFNKGGTLVTRFSDLADREGVSDRPNHVHDIDAPNVIGAENRYETQLSLPPGAYNLRVVLGDGKRFGRAEIPFTVDAFDRKELGISPVSLCKQIDDVSVSGHASILPGAWTVKLSGNYVPLVSDDIEFKPTADTRFKKDETLYAYFEVYEPLLATAPSTTVEFRIRIIDLKTGELRSDSPPVSATPYVKPGSAVIPIGRRTNISNLPKGSYRLDVQATDSTGKATPWRSVNFTVE
jgi:hypothetical protein